MEDAGLRGTINLSIKEDDMEAVLRFVPDEEGEVWDRKKILSLLEEKGIPEEMIDTKALDSFLEEGMITVAKGTPPQNPQDEIIEWEELSVPEKRQAEAHAVMENAGPPQIVLTRVEKTERKKKREKPGKLPFGQPKTEIVTVVDKKEITEPAPIDPKITSVAWVETGDKIATLTPAKPGKMGKDVFGTPLLVEEEPKIGLYPGNGVEKRHTEVTAKKTGFLRRGSNWAEVIPFEDHTWDLKLSADNADCLIDFTPGNRAAELPTAGDIALRAEELGYNTEYLESPEEIRALLAEAVKKEKTLEGASLSLHADAEIDISVTEDNLKAFLRLVKGRGGGKKLSLKEIGGALKESGIKGFRTEKVKADIIDFFRGTDFVLEDYLLAEGKPPEDPGEAEVEFTVTPLSEKEEEKVRRRLEEPADVGALDEVRRMGFVVRHQPVLHVIPPEKGVPGRDVYGRELKPKEPVIPEVVLLGNVKEEGREYVAERAGLFQAAEADGRIPVRVVPYREGKAELRMTEDKMKAYLTIVPAEGGGTNPELETVLRMIKERGIARGVREERVEEAVRTAEAGEPVEEMLVAVGEEPRHATRNQIEFSVDVADGSKVSIRKDGSVDYRNQNRITLVKKGQPLARLMPPEETGKDGFDLTGKTVPAKSFQGYDIEIGEGVHREEEDDGSVKLTAEYEGKLLYDKKSIAVKRVHVVDGDVDLSSGNVKFKGAVQVKGSVESGFTVLAGDSITIGESVDGALLSAEGDITINQGVKGRGKAVIRTKGAIKAGFAEQSTLLAVHDVQLKNHCFRSFVKTNGKIRLIGEKGHFIGGSARARMGLEVNNLGAVSGIKTEVSFGQDYLVADQIEAEEREIEKIKKKLLEFDSFMAKMEKEGNRAKLEQARKEKFKIMKIMEKRSLRLFTFREKFEQHFPGEIKIRGTVFPGVVIESHGRFLEIKEEKKNIVISFDLENGQIREAPAGSNAETRVRQ